MSLLEEAMKVRTKKKAKRVYSDEETELAMAWVKGLIDSVQLGKVLKDKNAVNKIPNMLRQAFNENKVKFPGLADY